MMRRALITLATLAGFTLSTLDPAAAQTEAPWPSRPVRLIVPFPAGGTSDQMARLAADELGRALKQPFVVDNKAGANGNIGSDAAAKAPADGYTLVLSGIGSHAINPGLYERLPFDANRDFVHISQLIAGPNVLVVHPSLAARNLKELLAQARANPGKLSYASSGSGSSGHLAMELLKQVAKVSMVHIPYRGGSPALNDVLANQVPMMFINQDVALPYVKAGRLRVLAVAGPQRNALYPEVPTVAESGFPGFAAVSWVGLSAPRGTPAAVVERVHTELARAFQAPAVKSRLEASGFTVVTSTPAQYQAYVKAESERWAQVIRSAGIQPD